MIQASRTKSPSYLYLLKTILCLVSFFCLVSTGISQTTTMQQFEFEGEAECGANIQYVTVAGGGFSENTTVCIDLTDFGLDPASIMGTIPITLYYDLGFTSVDFFTADNPTVLVPGVTNGTFGAGGVAGDHFAFAELPADGSTEICATVVVDNAGSAEDMGLFANIPINNPAFCNGSIFGTALDNELIASGGVPECAEGSFALAPGGSATDLINVNVNLGISEVIPGDNRPIEIYFEACGVIVSQTLDPEPPAGETGFAIVEFVIEDIPGNCTELNYEFCSPDGGQSFGIGGFSAEVQCPPSCIASNNGPLCGGDSPTIMLFGEEACGATYVWSGPEGFTSSDQNPAIVNAIVDNAGVYSLTVISADGIEVTCETTVEINQVISATTQDDEICVGETATISVAPTSGLAPFTYIWSSGLGTTASVMASPPITTLYTVTVSDANGCDFITTATVVVNPVPVATASNDGPVCNGDDVTLSSGPDDFDYSWTGPGGFTSTMQLPTTTVAGDYTVTVTDPTSGCFSTATTTVTIDPLPTLMGVASNTTCQNDDGMVMITPVGNGPFTFLWSNGETTQNISDLSFYDLALTKVTTSTGPYVPGSNVVFDICVVNQGTLDAADVEVTDYIQTGMNFVSSPDFVLTNGVYVATIPSILAGNTECVEITLMIDQSFMGTSLSNDAEITADDGDDIDSTPGDDATPIDVGDNDDTSSMTGGDDQDPEVGMIGQTYDLALAKTITSMGPYASGDNVDFEICVINQGTLDAADVEVTDYIPSDMIFVSSPDFVLTNGAYVATIPSLPTNTTECVTITFLTTFWVKSTIFYILS